MRSESPSRLYGEPDPLHGSGRLGRSDPAGPVERQEWLDALSDVALRVSSLEQTTRNHAQSIAVQNACTSEIVEKLTTTEGKLKVTDDDIAAYKQYMNKVMYVGTDSIAETLKALDRRNDEYITMSTETINSRVSVMAEKMDTMQATLESLIGHIHQGRTQHFNVETPVIGQVVQEQAEHPSTTAVDPMQQEVVMLG